MDCDVCGRAMGQWTVPSTRWEEGTWSCTRCHATTHAEPRHLLVRAQGEPSPLYEPHAGGAYEDIGTFTRNVPLDDSGPSLPEDLADALRSWSLSRPPEGFVARPDLRKHVKQGLAAAQRLARHLGPSGAVRHWDERHRTSKWVCWGCDRLHYERDSHGTPAHPLHITVEGEFTFGPLRSDGFGDFFPEDPAAALHLSDSLAADLYTWAKSIDTTLNLDVRDREDGKYDAEWQRLFREGTDLARRVAHELGPVRTVTYKGLAHGGPAALTSITWRGDRQL
ncbi:hypothetical protein AB0D57_24220 [Streptomyces sp. NPDC048275]|uniref:hypothetical protein n=1 Tax=Streptomyces sp. NPDC048275 TaxID=3155629 RepID=UPI0033D49835